MPIHIKLQKGAFKGLKNDLYATIEWFYFHGTGEEHGKSTQPYASQPNLKYLHCQAGV
jgi:hypothetical protein